ncbi:MAG: DUF4169 family protein [Alphaproteobacteria bacterium]|nr:DUF4169 family protein [Alphaproteobacteria bacterium]
MVEIVNLTRARKDRARREKSQAAAENRVRFGRTKAEKARDRDDARRRKEAQTARRLDDGETGKT